MNTMKMLALPLLVALLHCEFYFSPGFRNIIKQYADVLSDRTISSDKLRHIADLLLLVFRGRNASYFNSVAT